jgi:hypothetical protein
MAAASKRAEIQRRFRRRNRLGIIRLVAEANEVEIASLLEQSGFLDPLLADDRGAIITAFSKMIASMTSATVTGNDAASAFHLGLIRNNRNRPSQ